RDCAGCALVIAHLVEEITDAGSRDRLVFAFGHRISDKSYDIVALGGEQLRSVSELCLISPIERVGDWTRSGRCEDVNGSVRGVARVAQHLRILHRFGRKEQRQFELKLAGLPRRQYGVRRVRSDPDPLRIRVSDPRQLGTNVRNSLLIRLLAHDRSTQLGELRLERTAAADAAFIIMYRTASRRRPRS